MTASGPSGTTGVLLFAPWVFEANVTDEGLRTPWARGCTVLAGTCPAPCTWCRGGTHGLAGGRLRRDPP